VIFNTAERDVNAREQHTVKNKKSSSMEMIVAIATVFMAILMVLAFFGVNEKEDSSLSSLKDSKETLPFITGANLKIDNSSIDRSAICVGDNCKAENTTNIYPEYPEGFFTRAMFFNLQLLYDLNIFSVKYKNLLFIKNDITKKAFFQRPIPNDKNIHYGLCTEEFTECKVFDKFIFEEETMKDSVCLVHNKDFLGNCAYIVSLQEIPEEKCQIKPTPPGWPIKMNFLEGENPEKYFDRCVIKE